MSVTQPTSPSDVVIHVGKHKCASTYLQNQIFPQIADRVFSNKRIKRILRTSGLTKETLLGYVNKGADATGLTFEDGKELLIISREGLSHKHFEQDPVEKAIHLKNAYPRARILLLVREQFDMLLTLYAWQTCKQFLNLSVSEYADKLMRDEPYFLLHDTAVEAYVTVFGKENVHVVPFELVRTRKDDFFRDIADWVRPGVQIEVPKERLNESIKDRRALFVIRMLNVIFFKPISILNPAFRAVLTRKGYQRYQWVLTKSTKKFIGPQLSRMLPKQKRLQVPDDVRTKYASQFAKSNHRTVELCGVDLAAFGYPM